MSKTKKFVPFSAKQKKILTWWLNDKVKHNDAIIADGAIRAGKTSVMSLSFVIWSMSIFNGSNLVCLENHQQLQEERLDSIKSNVKTKRIYY